MNDLVLLLTGLQMTTDETELQAEFRQGATLYALFVPRWMDLKPGDHYKITFTPVDAEARPSAQRERGGAQGTSSVHSLSGGDEGLAPDVADGSPCDSAGQHRTSDSEDRAESSRRTSSDTSDLAETRSSADLFIARICRHCMCLAAADVLYHQCPACKAPYISDTRIYLAEVGRD